MIEDLIAKLLVNNESIIITRDKNSIWMIQSGSNNDIEAEGDTLEEALENFKQLDENF